MPFSWVLILQVLIVAVVLLVAVFVIRTVVVSGRFCEPHNEVGRLEYVLPFRGTIPEMENRAFFGTLEPCLKCTTPPVQVRVQLYG